MARGGEGGGGEGWGGEGGGKGGGKGGEGCLTRKLRWWIMSTSLEVVAYENYPSRIPEALGFSGDQHQARNVLACTTAVVYWFAVKKTLQGYHASEKRNTHVCRM